MRNFDAKNLSRFVFQNHLECLCKTIWQKIFVGILHMSVNYCQIFTQVTFSQEHHFRLKFDGGNHLEVNVADICAFVYYFCVSNSTVSMALL